MEFNNKKLSRTSRIIHYGLSTVLAIFLIGLANRIIGDLDGVSQRPLLETFEATSAMRNFQARQDGLQLQQQELDHQTNRLDLRLELYQSALKEQQASFTSWISTRRATQSNAINAEIQRKNTSLDSLQGMLKALRADKIKLKATLAGLQEQKRAILALMSKERTTAYNHYQNAVRAYELKLFLSRLLFVLPILLIGVWIGLKKRKSNYWPLYRGFVFFSGYAFFVGLLPYLPSYGGYVRYSIGILLSVFLGIYAIRSLRRFIARKKETLQRSTIERSKSIKEEVAEKALDQHMCPSCGKDFLINELHQTKSSKAVTGQFKVTPFCRHCGLELFTACSTCKTQNYAHLPHCYSCGDPMPRPQ
ncbi:MAG: hypothetical protein ABNH00_11435 [Dokdonia sp.]|jgi:predicted RNA-binding Zn-ribbon protein involved in translation (DUF1610 family)|nr:hypothetical protein [Cytophagaceae bacterium]